MFKIRRKHIVKMTSGTDFVFYIVNADPKGEGFRNRKFN